jgi:hypothetical protein
VLVETYGIRPEDRDGKEIRASKPGEVYACDDYVYWGFGQTGIARLARDAGFERTEALDEVVVDGHPRVLARLIA